ncbi:IS110 family transposase [Peribacillus sp. NPDC097224]|uniref:IS110 family transposase n=1 Tax=Peribacillus sp. NPDC097224 TaxID=3364399 RepID=UPI0038111002
MNQLDRTKCVFVGVDLHKTNHVAVLTDCFGDKIKTFNLKNAFSAFPAFVEQVKKKSDGKEIVFGLEDANFYGRSLARYLLDSGFIVKEVNSSYTKKQRSIGTNHNKSDELDALAVAKTLIFEYKHLPFADPQDVYLAIKQTLNTRNNYVQMTANIKMSLQNILVHHYPMHKEFFKDLESKTAKGFFKKYPSPNLLEAVTERELMEDLKKFNKSVPKKKAKEILEAIDSNGWNKTDYQKEQNESVISFINSLEHIENQIDGLDKTLDNLIEVTGYPLKTINGIDTVLAATFIANIGDVNRFPKANKLAKLAGIAPLEHSSGESQRNYLNKLGNRELNKAFYSLALTQIRKNMNPIMYEYYQSKIKEGRKKKQAMVYVERRLVNIVFSIMKTKTPYRQPVLENESA